VFLGQPVVDLLVKNHSNDPSSRLKGFLHWSEKNMTVDFKLSKFQPIMGLGGTLYEKPNLSSFCFCPPVFFLCTYALNVAPVNLIRTDFAFDSI
jgi:hypothetical protein